MRVLPDECMPQPLRSEQPDREVRTVPEMGCQGKRNGDLIDPAAGGGFDAFVTIDQSLQYQQSLEGKPIAVIAIAARSNRVDDLRPTI